MWQASLMTYNTVISIIMFDVQLGITAESALTTVILFYQFDFTLVWGFETLILQALIPGRKFLQCNFERVGWFLKALDDSYVDIMMQVPAAVEELAGGKWQESIPLNGSQDEVEELWDRLIVKRNASKKTKKEKKIAMAEGSSKLQQAVATPEERTSSGDSPTNTTDEKVSGDKLSKKERKEREAQLAGQKRPMQDFSISTDKLHTKKLKASDMAPANADKKIWASLFTSSHAKTKETYGCRSTMGRGWMWMFCNASLTVIPVSHFCWWHCYCQFQTIYVSLSSYV